MAGWAKRGFKIVKNDGGMISTSSGLIEGWECNKVLDALNGRLLTLGELFGRSGGRVGCRVSLSHGFLAVVMSE